MAFHGSLEAVGPAQLGHLWGIGTGSEGWEVPVCGGHTEAAPKTAGARKWRQIPTEKQQKIPDFPSPLAEGWGKHEAGEGRAAGHSSSFSYCTKPAPHPALYPWFFWGQPKARL